MKVNAKEAILKYLQNKPMPGYLEVSFSFTMFNEVSHPSSQVSRHKNAALGLNRFYRNHFVHLEPRNQKEHTTDNPTLFRTQQKPLVLSLTHTALLLVHIGPITPASAVCSSCGILCARLPKRLPPAQVKWEETSPPPFSFSHTGSITGCRYERSAIAWEICTAATVVGWIVHAPARRAGGCIGRNREWGSCGLYVRRESSRATSAFGWGLQHL